MKSKSTIAVSILLFSFWGAVPAQAADEHHGHDAAKSSELTQTHLGRGVIESIDAGKGVVTLDHQAIKSLHWPQMVMAFKAQDPALLKGLKEGDQVEFDLSKVGKEYHITRITLVR
jgi:Cu/Ag efflux protein CusF